MINTPPYYNAAAANYATNAAYLYGNQSNYGLQRNSGGINSAASFPNYFAASNPVNSLNYGKYFWVLFVAKVCHIFSHGKDFIIRCKQ